MIKRNYFISVEWTGTSGDSTGWTSRVVWRKTWLPVDPAKVMRDAVTQMRADFPAHGPEVKIIAFNRL